MPHVIVSAFSRDIVTVMLQKKKKRKANMHSIVPRYQSGGDI